MRSFMRPLGVIALGLSPVILFTACGGDDDDETANTPLVPIQETSYVVKEPATTTTTLAPDASAAGGVSPVEQRYVVVAGDALSLIASKHGITIDVLVAYNEWPEGNSHPIYPGDEVLIPPGSKIPGAATAADDEADAPATEDTEDTGDTAAETDSTEADTDSTDGPPSGSGDECEAGSYTITADDTTRLKVAEKFDVTVEALDAANSGTSGYSGFYPGLVIVIPCVA